MTIHYTDNYLLNPQHVITVNLIGAGGTGSQVITGLARLNEALKALNHPGIHVTCYDADNVSDANIGRQMFSPADLHVNKAVCLVSRVNRFFGYDWSAVPEFYSDEHPGRNITISCIDSAAGRIAIANSLKSKQEKGSPTNQQYYWLDFGNLKKTGQVVLGTVGKIKQPTSKNKTVELLPTVKDLFPELAYIKEEDQGPSCSLAEAINKQDLFINSTIAQLGLNLLWKLFREGMITHHGCYLNLDTMIVNPIKIA